MMQNPADERIEVWCNLSNTIVLLSNLDFILLQTFLIIMSIVCNPTNVLAWIKMPDLCQNNWYKYDANTKTFEESKHIRSM